MLFSAIPGSKQYRLYKHSATFKTARLECNQFGGDLAIINSENVTDLIQQNFGGRSAGFTYIGMTRANRESWFHLDNTRVPLPDDGANSEYQNWGRGQPSNSNGNEECGSISQGGSWNDISCDTPLHFICERGKIINRYFV